MTQKRDSRGPISAGELAARLAVDPEYAEIRRESDMALEAQRKRYPVAAAPVLEEFRLLGYDVSEIGDLRVPGAPRYRDAVPILVEWLAIARSEQLARWWLSAWAA